MRFLGTIPEGKNLFCAFSPAASEGTSEPRGKSFQIFRKIEKRMASPTDTECNNRFCEIPLPLHTLPYSPLYFWQGLNYSARCFFIIKPADWSFSFTKQWIYFMLYSLNSRRQFKMVFILYGTTHNVYYFKIHWAKNAENRYSHIL